MGVKRVQMAADAGANVIVTACPFCMVNIEDAIKVAGLEGKMTAIDLAELVDRQIARGTNTESRSDVTGQIAEVKPEASRKVCLEVFTSDLLPRTSDLT